MCQGHSKKFSRDSQSSPNQPYLPGEGTPYNGQYGGGGGGAPPESGTFLMLQVNERVGISLVEEYEKSGKSVISVCSKKAQEG